MEPGTVVAERWTLEEQIATGAMGRIFRARAVDDGHEVAVKILTERSARDPEAVQRFLREARVTQQLEHPNIVRVEAYGLTPDEKPYLVMELLHGESLEAVVERGAAVPPGEVLAMVRQIAAALDAAHAAGVVHRDLKPANLFVSTRDGRAAVTVLDFGAAKITDHLGSPDGILTAADKLLGTPLYMSPEQIRSARDVDHRTDLWALGVVAYELLAGAAPFESGPLAELFVEILSRPIPRLSERVPGIGSAVDRWVARALDRDREKRFQKGSELAGALDAALRPEPPARAPSAATRTASTEGGGWPRARVVLAVTAVGVALLVALALAALR